METVTLVLLSMFLIKHLIFDFFLQDPYQYLNKGTYGHAGGVLHAAVHLISSFLIMMILFRWLDFSSSALPWLWALCLAEGIIHYHMDWFKIWWCKRNNYKAHTALDCTLKQAHWFWWWVGIDQFVHMMTYVAMTWITMFIIQNTY